MSGAAPAAGVPPSGFSSVNVGLFGSLLKVETAASGGLLVRNVNEFIWFGL